MGWNGSEKRFKATTPQANVAARNSVEKRSGRNLVHGFVAGIIVIATAVVLMVLVREPKDTAPKQVRESRKNEVVTHLVAPATNAQLQSAVCRPNASVVKRELEVVPGKPAHPAPQIRRGERNPRLNGFNTRVVWQSTTEQLLLQLVCCPLGHPPKPISRIPEYEMKKFLDILNAPPEQREDDDEDELLAKDAIADAKKELAAYVSQGGKPDDFIKYYQHELENACEMRNEAMNEIHRIAEEEKDSALARQFMTKVNEMFKEEGILEIDMDIEDYEE